jgi:hypothetical protein
MHNGSAAFSLLVRQLVCANPIEYGIVTLFNFFQNHIITKIELSGRIIDSKGKCNDNL